MTVGTSTWQGSSPKGWGKFPWWLVLIGLVLILLVLVLGPVVQSYSLAKKHGNTVVGTHQNKNMQPGETSFANVTLQFTNTPQGCNVHRFGVGSISQGSNLFPKPCKDVTTDEVFDWLEETLDTANKWVVRVLRDRVEYVRQLRLLLRFLPPAP